MNSSTNRLIIIIFLLFIGLHHRANTAKGDEAQLKTVLFFVGNEIYADEDMNKLKYQAEDAYRLWKKFCEVNDVDLERSKLLIANDPIRFDGGHLPSEEELEQKVLSTGKPTVEVVAGGIKRSHINDAFDDFLRGVESGDLVIVYFGGHGEKVRGKLCYCPTDFKNEDGFATGEIAPDDLIKDKLKPLLQNKQNVHAALLLNMCHAGALKEGALSTESISMNDVDTSFQSLKAGMPNALAIIPACSGRHRTYEFTKDSDPDRSSIYTYALLQALDGGIQTKSNDDLVHADQIHKYMIEKYKELQLDFRPPDILPDQDVPLFRSSKLVARDRLEFAKGALAVANDLKTSLNSAVDRNRFEEQIYRIASLAKSQFEIVKKLERKQIELNFSINHCLNLMEQSKRQFGIEITEEEFDAIGWFDRERQVVRQAILQNIEQLPDGEAKNALKEFVAAKANWESATTQKNYLVLYIPLNLVLQSTDNWDPFGNEAEFLQSCRENLNLVHSCFADRKGFKGLICYSRDQGFVPFDTNDEAIWSEFLGKMSSEGIVSYYDNERSFTEILTGLGTYLESFQSELEGKDVDLFVVANSSLNFKVECSKLWKVLEKWKAGNIFVDGTRACVFSDANDTWSVEKLSNTIREAYSQSLSKGKNNRQSGTSNLIESKFKKYAVKPNFPVSMIRWNVPTMVNGFVAADSSAILSDPLIWRRPDIYNKINSQYPNNNRRFPPGFLTDVVDDYYENVASHLDQSSSSPVRRKLILDGDPDVNPLFDLIPPSLNWDELMPPAGMIGDENANIYSLLSEAANSELQFQGSRPRAKPAMHIQSVQTEPMVAATDPTSTSKKYQAAKTAVAAAAASYLLDDPTPKQSAAHKFLQKLGNRIAMHCEAVNKRQVNWRPKKYFLPIVPTEYDSPIIPDRAPVIQLSDWKSRTVNLDDAWSGFDEKLTYENCTEVIDKTIEKMTVDDLAIVYLNGYVAEGSAYKFLLHDSELAPKLRGSRSPIDLVSNEIANSLSLDDLVDKFSENDRQALILLEYIVPEDIIRHSKDFQFMGQESFSPNPFPTLPTNEEQSYFAESVITQKTNTRFQVIKSGQRSSECFLIGVKGSSRAIPFEIRNRRDWFTTSKLLDAILSSVHKGRKYADWIPSAVNLVNNGDTFFVQGDMEHASFTSRGYEMAYDSNNDIHRLRGNVEVTMGIFGEKRQMFTRNEDLLLFLSLEVRRAQLSEHSRSRKKMLLSIDPSSLEPELIQAYLELLLAFQDLESLSAEICLQKLNLIIDRSLETRIIKALRKEAISRLIYKLVEKAVNADENTIVDAAIQKVTGANSTPPVFSTDDEFVKLLRGLRSGKQLKPFGSAK